MPKSATVSASRWESARVIARERPLALQQAMDSLTAELMEVFGWTDLAAAVTVLANERVVRISGAVALASVRTAALVRLVQLVPVGWRIDSSSFVVRRTGGWRALTADETRIYRSPYQQELATVLLAEDGPVQVLARPYQRSVLMRASDGTVGWSRCDGRPLRRAAPRLFELRSGISADALVRELRQYDGVPYLAGGTTRVGVDCSGLVQRAFRAACGMIIPKHSADQLRFSKQVDRGALCQGDVVYSLGADRDYHVGVVTRFAGVGGMCVIHASRSRGRVVEEDLTQFLQARTWLRVPFEAFVGSWIRQVGRSTLAW